MKKKNSKKTKKKRQRIIDDYDSNAAKMLQNLREKEKTC